MAQLQKKASIMMMMGAMLLVLLALACSNGVAEAAPACQGTINALASACGQFATGKAPPNANCCGLARSIKPATVTCLCQNIPPGIGSSVISKIVHACGISGSFCGGH